MEYNLRFLLLLALCAVGYCMHNSQRAAGLSFAASYGNHMVLQQAPKQAVIWGHATKIGDTVHVFLDNQEVAHTTVQQNLAKTGGMWQVTLPAQSSHGPFTIRATSSEGSVTMQDVLFGDVWICSGQSNMEYRLSGTYNATAELHDVANYPNIRIFHVRKVFSATPYEDVTAVDTHWSKANSNSARSFSALCWLYGKYLYPHLNYPIGLVESSWGGTIVETWSSPDALAKCQHHGKRAANTPSNLWNAMINPLLKMTIYGAIWYQGESNAGRAQAYNCSFPAMIDDWRQKFHQASGQTDPMFPFGFVQLAAWRHNDNLVGGFPLVRWSQTADVGYVPNARLQKVFMAVALDLPDYHSPHGSIHPRDKQTVASRLALSARAVAYNVQGIDYQAPFPSQFTLQAAQHKLIIEYDHGAEPIKVLNNKGFEICCASSASQCPTLTGTHWINSPVSGHQGSTLTLDTSGCHAPLHVMGVRYAWHESPCDYKQCAIYDDDNGLPGPPFIHIGL